MSFDLIAPIMFGGLVVFLLLGYPVAFSLAFTGLAFAAIGIWHGSLDMVLLQALPSACWGSCPTRRCWRSRSSRSWD